MASKTVIITTWRSLTSYLQNNVRIHFPMTVSVSGFGKNRTVSLSELDQGTSHVPDYETEPEISLLEKGIYTDK